MRTAVHGDLRPRGHFEDNQCLIRGIYPLRCALHTVDTVTGRNQGVADNTPKDVARLSARWTRSAATAMPRVSLARGCTVPWKP